MNFFEKNSSSYLVNEVRFLSRMRSCEAWNLQNFPKQGTGADTSCLASTWVFEPIASINLLLVPPWSVYVGRMWVPKLVTGNLQANSSFFLHNSGLSFELVKMVDWDGLTGLIMRWGVWSVLYKHGCVIGEGDWRRSRRKWGRVGARFIYIAGPICIISKLKGSVCKLNLKLRWIRLPCLGRVWRSEPGPGS